MNQFVKVMDGFKDLIPHDHHRYNHYLSKDRSQLDKYYRSSWVVGAAVDVIADDMTRSGIDIIGDNSPEDIDKINKNFITLQLWNALNKLIKYGRLYGGAVAYVDIKDQNPSTPLDVSTIDAGQFQGLKIFTRHDVMVRDFNWVLQGNSTPEFYSFNSAYGGSYVVHHSRVLRFLGIDLPPLEAAREQGWGASVLERVIETIDNFTNTSKAAGFLVQKAHLRVIQIEGLREILAAGGDSEAVLIKMFAKMNELQDIYGITLLDKKDSFMNYDYTFGGLNDVVTQFANQIAGALGIPLVRLFGQSPAGLNSTGESDFRMYYDNIFAQQEARLRSILDVLLRVVCANVGVEPAANLDFNFNYLGQMTEEQRIAVAKATTETVVEAFNAGIITAKTAKEELAQSSQKTGIFTNISQEDIDNNEFAPPEPDADPEVLPNGV